MDAGPKISGRFAKGNPGKPKGAVSKTTKIAKEVIAQAADRLGGVDRLVDWAMSDAMNERAFWAQIYPKLLPLQLTGEGGGPIELVGMTKEQRDAAVAAASRADA